MYETDVPRMLRLFIQWEQINTLNIRRVSFFTFINIYKTKNILKLFCIIIQTLEAKGNFSYFLIKHC